MTEFPVSPPALQLELMTSTVCPPMPTSPNIISGHNNEFPEIEKLPPLRLVAICPLHSVDPYAMPGPVAVGLLSFKRASATITPPTDVGCDDSSSGSPANLTRCATRPSSSVWWPSQTIPPSTLPSIARVPVYPWL